MLRDSAVGLFPSYVEGFGLAMLEQLAAGIPTIVGAENREFLVPVGDVNAMTQRAIELLDLSPNEYAALAERCRSIASNFAWEQIAANTIDEYRARISDLGSVSSVDARNGVARSSA